jgi:uncharacterized LabA/DUF88 family protein
VPVLRASIIIDYQNVHLTGHGLFACSRALAPHESLVHPLHFANQLIHARNQAQRPGNDHARLSRVIVNRGLPAAEHDPKPYARNLAQKAEWERDSRVTVTLRPLKYQYERDQDGHPVSGPDGKRIVTAREEKGVDVLCALALLREARRTDIDVVILASHDSDLEPAIDEALDQHYAKIETFSWFDRTQPNRTRQLRPSRGRSVWNTRLGEPEFRNCWDLTTYP